MGNDTVSSSPAGRWRRRIRVAWAIVTLFVVESLVLGVAALPAVAFWNWNYHWTGMNPWLRVLVLSMAFVPAYLLFAFGLMIYSALATRVLGWRTKPGLATPIVHFEWPLLDWARYLVTTHVVRLFAGAVFRSSPVWTMYMRLNGARIGRGAWVNSLLLMDHNLLDIGQDSIVGSNAYVSGHTVEGGVLKTASVRIGRRATIGINSVIEIGAEVGDDAQVGALSVVPKDVRLEPGGVYAGAPARLVVREPGSGTPDSWQSSHAPR